MTEEIKPLSPSTPSIAPKRKTSPDQQGKKDHPKPEGKRHKQAVDKTKRPKKGLFDEFV